MRIRLLRDGSARAVPASRRARARSMIDVPIMFHVSLVYSMTTPRKPPPRASASILSNASAIAEPCRWRKSDGSMRSRKP